MANPNYSPSAEDEEDKRLMALVAQGDDHALRQLVDRPHPRLVGSLQVEVGSISSAERIEIEDFSWGHFAYSTLPPQRKHSTPHYHITRNTILKSTDV